MLTYFILIVVGAIATVGAGLVTPAPVVRAYGLDYSSPYNLVPIGTLVIPKTFYDDGSYKPQASPVAIAASPYGFVPAGSGFEGHYVPDNIDKLYDDGSYKPQPNTVSLRVSPYGLVPAGSGLEGQYVPDYNEKFYDDGSYKPEHV